VNHVICFSGENSGANEACGDGALSGPPKKEFDALMKQLAISWKIS
jgi:hypothetical protein